MTLDSLLVGQPWAVTPETLEGFVAVLAAKRDGVDLEQLAANLPGGQSGGRRVDLPGNVAEIMISGTLSKRAFAFDCGTSYARIQEQIQAALDDRQVKAILLNVDSPGGTVPGVQELAKFIRNADAQKPIYAWTDGAMTSAAYWIGSAARFVAANDTASVGSIGVYLVHEERSQADAASGVVRTVIKAGSLKALGNDAEPLTDAARAEIQGRMDQIYEVFVSAVASHRNVPAEEALAMADGKVFLGQAALEIGLIDAVMTRAQVVEKLSKEIFMKLSDLQANHPDLVKEIQAAAKAEAEAGFSGKLNEAVQKERAKVVDLAGVFLGDDAASKLATLAESGMTKEQAVLAMDLAGGKAKADDTPSKADVMLDEIRKAGADQVQQGQLGADLSEDPVQAWDALVDTAMKGGSLSRAEALKKMAQDHPKAHQNYLATFRQDNK